MTKKTLYRYEREGGGITVSPIKHNVKYTEMFRLIADDGKMLTKDGEHHCAIIDVQSVDGWYEVDKPNESEDE